MTSQQRRRIARYTRWLRLHRWRWLSLAVVCLVVAYVVNPAMAPLVDVPYQHSTKVSVWTQAVHAVQSVLDEGCADQFTVLQDSSSDPTMPGVVSYLRAHQVEQRSSWEQLITRVRCSLQMR